MNHMPSFPPPLEGIRILDLSRLIPGAFCTAMLADLGAEVIKVEEPSIGDYERQIAPFCSEMASRFLILNRNKKSVVLDLKKQRGKEIFLRLAEKSDVLLESFRPGVMANLGLDYESLKKDNPSLVYCSISSFGQDGPYRDMVAHDLNILGLAGILDITGSRESGPVLPGVQLTDSATAMTAAVAILAAILHKGHSHLGQYLDISMLDSTVAWTFDAARYAFSGEPVPARGQGRLWGGLPNYRIYITKDGKYLAVGSLEAKFKERLMQTLGRDDLRGHGREETTTKVDERSKEDVLELEELFATRTQLEWLDLLGAMNICVTPVLSIEEALAHPQVVHRHMVLETQHPLVGAIRQLGSPFKMSRAEVNIERLPAPRLGQHTQEVLASLGWSREEIGLLAEQKVVDIASDR